MYIEWQIMFCEHLEVADSVRVNRNENRFDNCLHPWTIYATGICRATCLIKQKIPPISIEFSLQPFPLAYGKKNKITVSLDVTRAWIQMGLKRLNIGAEAENFFYTNNDRNSNSGDGSNGYNPVSSQDPTLPFYKW